MKFVQTHLLEVPVDTIEVMVKDGRVYDVNGIDLGPVENLKLRLERLTVVTRTVFVAQHVSGMYFSGSATLGPIDEASIFFTKGHVERLLLSSDVFNIIEYKLVEIKPTVRITLTSGDRVWARDIDSTKPLRRDALSELLLQDIKWHQDRGDKVRSGELRDLRAILQYASSCVSHGIKLGGVLLGHIECEVL